MAPSWLWLLSIVGLLCAGCFRTGYDRPVHRDAEIADSGVHDGDVDAPDSDVEAADGDVDAADRDVNVHDPEWWDHGCSRRVQIELHNDSALALASGHPAELPLALGALFGPVSDDEVHLLWRSGGSWSELARVIDHPVGDGDVLWFSIPTQIGPGERMSDLYLYVGDCRAPPAGGEALFSLHDDFDELDTTTRWDLSGPAVVVDGVLLMDAVGSLISNTSYGDGYGVQFNARATDDDVEFWGGLQRTGDHVDNMPYHLWIARTPHPNEIFGECHHPGESMWVGPRYPRDDQWHTYRVVRFLDHTDFHRDGVFMSRHDHPDYAEPLRVRLHVDDDPPMVYTVAFDSVRVFPVVEAPPSLSLRELEVR